MAGLNGDFVAKTVEQGAKNVVATEWTLLAAGSSNLESRRHIKLFTRGKAGSAMGVAYANINADGTFTTPTDDIRLVTVYPGNSKLIEPLSDKVAIYGRLLKKAGTTDSSLRVICTEYR